MVLSIMENVWEFLSCVAWQPGLACQSRSLWGGSVRCLALGGARCAEPVTRALPPPPTSHRWYKLHSKSGKKEKERGEIQVTIQFTRNNLSASMFDLSMKDKPRSPFSKLKDKMKGKKKFDLESSSAILPSSALEDPELGSLGKMGKAKGFFLRNKLRKSSLTQSNTSLGSDSTLSSASGSLAYQGPGAEFLTRSPSRSSWLSTEGEGAGPHALGKEGRVGSPPGEEDLGLGNEAPFPVLTTVCLLFRQGFYTVSQEIGRAHV